MQKISDSCLLSSPIKQIMAALPDLFYGIFEYFPPASFFSPHLSCKFQSTHLWTWVYKWQLTNVPVLLKTSWSKCFAYQRKKIKATGGGTFYEFEKELFINVSIWMVHTRTDKRLNPTWVYLGSKVTRRTPSSRAWKWAPTWYVSRLAPRSL